jgi:hypothetical protein
VSLERPAPRGRDPKTECLTNVAWNFDWQRTYAFDAPFDQLPSISDGDIVDINCTWDNTINNPFAQRLLSDANMDQPFDVSFGDQTTNEMCLTIVGVAQDVPRNVSVENVASMITTARQLRREPSRETALRTAEQPPHR